MIRFAMADNPKKQKQPTPEEFAIAYISEKMRAELLAWEKANRCSDDDLLSGEGSGRPIGIAKDVR